MCFKWFLSLGKYWKAREKREIYLMKEWWTNKVMRPLKNITITKTPLQIRQNSKERIQSWNKSNKISKVQHCLSFRTFRTVVSVRCLITNLLSMREKKLIEKGRGILISISQSLCIQGTCKALIMIEQFQKWAKTIQR